MGLQINFSSITVFWAVDWVQEKPAHQSVGTPSNYPLGVHYGKSQFSIGKSL